MLQYFSNVELIDPFTNVTGRAAKGVVNDQLKPLDTQRIEKIKNVVLSYQNGDINDKIQTWRKCKQAMTKKLATLKQKK